MWKNVRAWLLGRLGAPPPLPPVLDPVGVATLKNELVSGELAEVILLLDHLSGRSDRSISNLQIDPAGGDLVEAVFKAHWPPSLNETDAEISTAATIMFKARDQLNELAYPANGASIAFTIMVTGEDPHDSAMGHGKISTTRKGLASRAYPRYAGAARDFRRFRTILFYSLVVALLGTGFLSWHATEGQFFLQTITENDAKLTALLPDFYAALGSDRADQVIASTKQVPSAALPQFCPPGTDARPSGSCPMTIAHFCDGTGEIHDPVGRLKLCTQFVGLSRSRCIAAYSVKLWYNNWRWLASFFGPIPNQDGGGAVPRTAPSTGRQPNAVSPPPQSGAM